MIGGSALTVFVALPVLLPFLGYLFISVPTARDAVSRWGGPEPARIVPVEGARIKVFLDQVPPSVEYAVLSAEDRTFYSNPGFRSGQPG
ncbi:transglycosylase domain-containing protein [Pseudonocardia spinosispora]|uniref:transglycosylase domain-containing protein n=1 Tax=Pseudonocardia spinosispora TaxID=103441 RepID=UPI0004278DAD|nr:transglycosylase domain-containing protein [Pseudonocardia spinosispora]